MFIWHETALSLTALRFDWALSGGSVKSRKIANIFANLHRLKNRWVIVLKWPEKRLQICNKEHPKFFYLNNLSVREQVRYFTTISWQCHFKFMVWSESELFVRIWIQYRKVRILLNLEMPNTIQSKMWAYTYNQLFFSFLPVLQAVLYCMLLFLHI